MEKLNRRRSACVRDFTGANEKARDITFQTFPKSVTVQEKESVEIECEILGKPTSGKLHRISMPIEHDDPPGAYNAGLCDTRARVAYLHTFAHTVLLCFSHLVQRQRPHWRRFSRVPVYASGQQIPDENTPGRTRRHRTVRGRGQGRCYRRTSHGRVFGQSVIFIRINSKSTRTPKTERLCTGKVIHTRTHRVHCLSDK